MAVRMSMFFSSMVLLLFSIKVNEQEEHSGRPQSNEESAVVILLENKKVLGIEDDHDSHEENGHFPKGEFF
jgi:hypothetical protein